MAFFTYLPAKLMAAVSSNLSVTARLNLSAITFLSLGLAMPALTQASVFCESPSVVQNKDSAKSALKPKGKNSKKIKNYDDVEKLVEKKIEAFANSKTIASLADAMLSKLIVAKSPVLTSWMQRRDLFSKSEDEIAHEWRKYFAENFILSHYPQKEADVNVAVKKLIGEILSETINKDFHSRLDTLFDRAQKNAVATLEQINPKAKKEIIERIQKIKLNWPSAENLKEDSNPLEIIEWGVAYDPVPNVINVGIQALRYQSDETILAVMSHEIGHSFDSCRWGAFLASASEGSPVVGWPFEKVGSCLRSADSVEAKKRDDSQIEKFVKMKRLTPELAAGLKQNATCNKLQYPPPGVQADQLAESFADWFSAEAMAHYLQDKASSEFAVTKMRQDLCEDKKLIDGSSYPTNEKRLEKIYLAHPVIQDALRKTNSNLVFVKTVHCEM